MKNTLALTNRGVLNTPFDLIDKIFDDGWDNFFHRPSRSSHYLAQWKDKDKKYSMEIEAPRYSPENIDIKVENNLLIVKGELKTDNNNYSFNRVYSLPEDSNGEYSAKLDKGILTIEVGKIEKAKPKVIEVKVK